jgi:hypothetical protein
MRVVQPKGCRGSLKWIQHFVNQHPAALDKEILRQLDGAGKITWVSPLADDEFAEYRDADFLRQVGLERLARPLAEFWPRRGPQWDALARTDHDDVLLIEAKAHVPELHSPPSGAGAASLEKIQKAFSEAAKAYAVSGEKPWHKEFYQLANRLAHLYFLRKHSVSAWLVLVNGKPHTQSHSTHSVWRRKPPCSGMFCMFIWM